MYISYGVGVAITLFVIFFAVTCLSSLFGTKDVPTAAVEGLLVTAIIGFLWWLVPSGADRAAQAAQQKAAETPHVVREADGCKVYAFERHGRDHYFTRCPATTDTETNWTESCGKNCTKHMSSNIVVDNELDKK